MKNLIFTTLILFIISCSGTEKEKPEENYVYGLRAIDGSTFKAYNFDKTKYLTIHINGLKSPQFGQKFYNPATTYLSQRIQNKKLKIERISELTENEIKANVFNDTINIAVDILGDGMAEVNAKDSISESLLERYITLQLVARNLNRGKW